MRIAYLTEWSPYGETGVLRKLISQIRCWRDLGAEASLFALAPRRDGQQPSLGFSEHGVLVNALSQRSLERFPWARLGYVNKVLSVPLMLRALKEYGPDVIYYRQNGPWYPGVGLLLSAAPVVIEINTDEAAEAPLWGQFAAAFLRVTQGWVHGRVAGFVCVTKEIAKKYYQFGKPVRVITNSMWGEHPSPLPTSSNNEPSFVFVGSKTVGLSSWHGVDKIFILAKKLPNSLFNIVGLCKEEFVGLDIPENVIFFGDRRGEELINIYRNSDIGLGTLALHRNSMNEACPLKTREYLMYGLPIVLGYEEADCELHNVPYILNIGNYAENVEDAIDRIQSFADSWKNRRVSESLHFLTPREKARQKLEFFAELVGQPSPAVDERVAG